MRNSILELLRASGLEPVSGEKISEQLGVSRTAIWKHIQALKDEGYQIESVQKRGYILREAPNRLYPQEISSHLKTKWLGHSVCYEDLLPSTNNVAKSIANAGCENGLLVIAEEQGAGKGRLSRGWVSPHAKGIWFSVVLKPPFLPQEASPALPWSLHL
jgi:BirA family biotin operon repressor/biotin-[acetyl-CoA-carboxylase] ligase